MTDSDTGTGRPPLWSGDIGGLTEQSRRALLEVLKGPYLSGRQQPKLWAALRADEREVRSRLHDLFLELVVDDVDEFAFARKIRTDELDTPSALRTEKLLFIDTVMLLVLRQLLLASAGRRVIVGQEEIYEQLAVYRSDSDESTYRKNLNAAWGRMANRYRVLHAAGDDRVEISPMVKFMLDEEQVRAITAVYREIAAGDSGLDATSAESDDREEFVA